jgi:hypothetical protein
MKRAIKVYCLDDNTTMIYISETPYMAMQAAIYYENLKHFDKEAHIELLGGGRTLAFTHHGKTYSCVNK